MRRVAFRVRTAELDRAYDELLPLLAGGVHPVSDGDETTLVALADELPDVGALAAQLGPLLVGVPVEEDAGDDVAAAVAALVPRYEIAGRAVLRDEHHAPPPDGWLDVVLGRSAGFGTGAHPTTRHVLEVLLDLEPGGGFADLGCGQGALTVAAAKLGYDPVVGIDLIASAVEGARANAARNGVVVQLEQGDLLALEALQVRVAVANVSETFVHEHLAGVPRPGLEFLVVSGLRDPAVLAAALDAYAAGGLREERRVGDAWPAVLLRR